MLQKLLSFPQLYFRGLVASRYASKRGTPGMEFSRFGRRMGARLASRGVRGGLGYLLSPVSIVRHFEFPFAYSCLPPLASQCLDVSSPNLFSLYIAHQKPLTSILMINPDLNDIALTADIVDRLGLQNVLTRHCGVDLLANQPERFDCIWAISVLEHIAGDYDDRDAIQWMYQAIKPGGRLIFTVPVDRKYWDENRDQDYYGTQPKEIFGDYFFQRYYDQAAIWQRLILPLGEEPSFVRWFGETQPGTYAAYEKRWIREGYDCTVNDPREIADHYREFSKWEEMPGIGVCGVMIEKRKA